MVVREGQNVTLTCKAKGFPEPYVMWRREDGDEMSISGENGEIADNFNFPLISTIFALLSYQKIDRSIHNVCTTDHSIPYFSATLHLFFPIVRFSFSYTVNVVDGEILSITKVSRLHMAAYLCVASNGVPPSISKRINLKVQCKRNFPKMFIQLPSMH